MTTAAPFLQRHLGDYLLVAQLSEDALGTVFRALHAADERHFVRLRILRTSELPADAIEAAIRENAGWTAGLSNTAIVDRSILDVVEDLPFLTWDETAGWTLDTMLARVRAFGIRIPAEYALLIAERIAAALEHVHRGAAEGGPAYHGLLWPGFVSISHDAAVRVGGFGLADAILPSLSKPRLAAEVAPYLAPESRDGGERDARTDVYALGMILAELLTGRRPAVGAPPPELRAGDPRSDELETFLGRCLAPRNERFASAVEAHREIQQMVTGNPFSLYTANLALFLYKLLNPESQVTAPATAVAAAEWENTNPVVINATSTQSGRVRRDVPAFEPPLPVGDAPAAPAGTPSAASLSETNGAAGMPLEDDDPISAIEEPVEVAAAFEAVAAIEAKAASANGSRASVEPAEIPAEAEEPPMELDVLVDEEEEPEPEPHQITEPPSEHVVFVFPEEGALATSLARTSATPPSDPALAPRAVVIPREVVKSPVPLWATAWTRPAGALAAAAGLTLGAFLIVSQFRQEGDVRQPAAVPVRVPAAAARGLAPAPFPAPAERAALQPPMSSAASAVPVAAVLSGGTSLSGAGHLEAAAAKPVAAPRPARPAPALSRQPAEDLRLRAALARVEADRVNARQTAGDLFGEGRSSEEEGERLLRQRDYQAAELAFSRAARLFQKAQELSWERRVRESDLGSAR